MPILGLRAFMAGVAVGWAGRSVAGSTREALVRAVVAGHEVRHDLRRAVAERWEWIEDLMAEGRIRYDESVTMGETPEPGETGEAGGGREPFSVATAASVVGAPPESGRAA